MAQNKVQYQRGLPMLEFFDLYGSHERCEDAIRCEPPRIRRRPVGLSQAATSAA